jgi:hypothetical protein
LLHTQPDLSSGAGTTCQIVAVPSPTPKEELWHEKLKMGIFYNHLLHSRLFSEMRVCRGLVAACDESEIVALDKNPAKKGSNTLNTMGMIRYNYIILSFEIILQTFFLETQILWMFFICILDFVSLHTPKH